MGPLVYGIVVLVILVALLAWLLVQVRERRQKDTPEQASLQVTLLGYYHTDGSVVGERLVHSDGTVIRFDPPVLLKPGDTLVAHLAIPEGCKPVGNNWRAFPFTKTDNAQ